MPVVDTHVHVVAPAGSARYPRTEGAATTEWVAGHAVEVDALIPDLDKAGVEKAVLVQALSAHGFDNSYTVDSARAHPGRFTSVGALDYAAEGAVATLNYWVADRGVRGIRLRPVPGLALDDEA